MDFDINADDQLGSDGCLDFTNGANVGLPALWCDDAAICPFKALYDENYASIMSRADFWVAAANAVIFNSSPNRNNSPRLNLPFRWGRVDSDDCPNSSSRIPEPGGCNDVEAAFITRMGLTWTDAVALLGAHTLGRGDIDFSGHAGTWVQDDERSTEFDNNFYRELLRRSWFPRETGVANDDWTWGGQNRNVLMLNTDICLRFDIDDGTPCCTNTNAGNCRGQNNQCLSSEEVRPDAFNAVNTFAGDDTNDNDAFFAAFTSAWVQATENGYDSLNELVASCEDTEGPTRSPSGDTEGPTPSPIGSCSDVDSFKDKKNTKRDCDWVLSKDKCKKYSKKCPVSCDSC